MISIQVGAEANYAMAHTWASLSATNERLARRGISSAYEPLFWRNKTGTVVMPRAVSIDFNGNYGPLPDAEKDDILMALDHDILGHGIELAQEEKPLPSTQDAFLNPTRDKYQDMWSLEMEMRKRAGIMNDRRFNVLLPRTPAAMYWTDVQGQCQFNVRIKEYEVGEHSIAANQQDRPMPFYSDGLELMKSGKYRDEVEESIRHWAEGLDRLEYMLLSACTDNGSVGMCDGVLAYLSDEFHKTQRALIDLSRSFCPATPNERADDSLYNTRVNKALLLGKAIETDCTIIPLSLTGSLNGYEWVDKTRIYEASYVPSLAISSIFGLFTASPSFNIVNPHKQYAFGYLTSCIYQSPLLYLRDMVQKRQIHLVASQVLEGPMSDAHKYVTDIVKGRTIDTRVSPREGAISEKELNELCKTFVPSHDMSDVTQGPVDLAMSETALYLVNCGDTMDSDDSRQVGDCLSYACSNQRRKRATYLTGDIQVSHMNPYDSATCRPSAVPCVSCLHTANEPIFEYLNTLRATFIPTKHIGLCSRLLTVASGIEREELEDTHNTLTDVLDVYE